MPIAELIADISARARPQVLFEEDFDLPPPAEEPPPQPEVIEPVFSAAELQVAREEAGREADQRARAEVAAAQAASAQASLAAIADQLGHAAAESRAAREDAAEAIAQLVLAGFAAAFPALSRRHGEVEVRAVLQRILPALGSEPKVTIRVAPALLGAVRNELARLDPDIAEMMQVIPFETLSPGDVRVHWHSGQAVRDSAKLWEEIEAILAPAGLLPPRSMQRQPAARETVDAE